VSEAPVVTFARLTVAAMLALTAAAAAAAGPCGAPVDFTPFKSQNADRDEIGRDVDAIVEQGFIEIGVYEDFPPYSWEEDGRLQGVDVALAELIAETLGVEARVRAVAAGERVDDDLRNWVVQGPAIDGRVVNVMMRVPWHPEFACRNELVAIGGQYHTEREGIAWRVEAFPDGPPTPADLVGATVAVENDSLADFYLARAEGGRIVPATRRFRTTAEAMAAVAAGEADAAMGPLAQLEWGARGVEGVLTAVAPAEGLSMSAWTVGVAVRHNVRDLGYAVGDAIVEAANDGRLAEIYAAHGLTWSPPEW
jgi:ABC-type amino acid transport substrate-binding protein